MDRDILLLIVGALIGFAGSTLSTFVSYALENKRTKRQWQREDFLRAESRRQEEIKLAQDFNMRMNLKKSSPDSVIATSIARDGFFCFLPETRITLANHETATIESLKVGDALLCYDLERNEQIERNVSEINKSEVEKYVVINEAIKVTESHLFWTKNGWQRSGDINLQHELYDMNGNYIPVTKLEKIIKHTSVYNLEIINNTSFYAENVLVSTLSKKQDYFARTISPEHEEDEDDNVLVFDPEAGELIVQKRKTESEIKVRQESFMKRYRISVAHPTLLSKRFSSLFLVQVYFPENRSKVSRTLAGAFGDQVVAEHIRDSELEMGQKIKLTLSSPEIIFSDTVIKKLDNGILTTNFTAKPNDNCHPGTHQVILSLSDVETQIEYQSISFTVKITDFAFDHISRPLLSNLMSIALGTSSLIMFVLTIMGQIDKTFGLASGTVAGTLASAIYVRFLSLYQQPRITNTP